MHRIDASITIHMACIQTTTMGVLSDGNIETLAIVFAVLCCLLLLTAIVMTIYIVFRKKTPTKGYGSSYKLDHRYDEEYDTSTHGEKSSTRSDNVYQVQTNEESKEVITSYHNVAYERPL